MLWLTAESGDNFWWVCNCDCPLSHNTVIISIKIEVIPCPKIVCIAVRAYMCFGCGDGVGVGMGLAKTVHLRGRRSSSKTELKCGGS